MREDVKQGLWSDVDLTVEDNVISVFREIYDVWELGGQRLRDVFYGVLKNVGWPEKRIKGMEDVGAKSSKWAAVGWSESSVYESLVEELKKVESLAELEVLAKDDPKFANVVIETVRTIEGIKYAKYETAINRMKQLALKLGDDKVLKTANETIETIKGTVQSFRESAKITSGEMFVAPVDKQMANQLFNLMKKESIFNGDFDTKFASGLGAVIGFLDESAGGRVGIIANGGRYILVAGRTAKAHLEGLMKNISQRVERAQKVETKNQILDGLLDGNFNIK